MIRGPEEAVLLLKTARTRWQLKPPQQEAECQLIRGSLQCENRGVDKHRKNGRKMEMQKKKKIGVGGREGKMNEELQSTPSP